MFSELPLMDAWVFSEKSLEAFAKLVRADERNSWPLEMEAMEQQVNILTDALAQERDRLKWDVHSCGPTCKRYACVAVREAVQAEREALKQIIRETPFSNLFQADLIEAIDKRGQA
jgi:hypothetical protein